MNPGVWKVNKKTEKEIPHDGEIKEVKDYVRGRGLAITVLSSLLNTFIFLFIFLSTTSDLFCYAFAIFIFLFYLVI